MNNLIIIQNNTTLTTSLAIAEGVGNEHKAVIQLVRKYLADLQEFGRVTFEMSPFETKGGVQEREVALLNEQQATLLLTYMQNTAIVREFKKVLVKAFYNLVEDRKRMAEINKYEVQIEAGNARIQASKDKAKASQLKLQALKDKLQKQSEILNAKTTEILARGAKVKGNMVVGKLDLPTDCITELLKQYGSPIEPKLANLCLRRLGYLTQDNKITELGLPFGKTIQTSPKAKTTLARWYVNEFPELLEKIMQEYEELVNE